MKIRLNILGDEMTGREVAALSRTLCDALSRLPEADSVTPELNPGPEASKGLGEVIGSIIMGLPGEAVTGVLGLSAS